MRHRIASSLLALAIMFTFGGPVASQTVKMEVQPALDLFGDALPPGALARLGTTRFRHGQALSRIAVSPNGKSIASAGIFGAIRIWDASTGIELREIPVDSSTGGLKALAFSPNGASLTAATDRAVFIWNAGSGSLIHRLKCFQSMELAFSPDGKILATINLKEGIGLWDVVSGERMGLLSPERLKGNRANIASVSFSPNGRFLASSHGQNSEIFLWDPTTRKQIRRMNVLDEGVDKLVFSPDSQTIAASGAKGTVCLLDVATASEIRRVQGYPGLTSIAFSPDGTIMASGSKSPFKPDATFADQDSFLRLWDVATGKELAQLGDHSAGVTSIAFSKDGSTLITAEGGAIRKYDVKTHKEIGPVCGHTSTVSALTFTSDGKSLVSGGEDTTVRIWDLATRKEIRQLYGCTTSVDCLAFSPRGSILAAACRHGIVRFWDLANPKLSWFIDVNKGKNSGAGGIGFAFSPDGTRFATLTHFVPATIWDVATKKKLQEFGAGVLVNPCIAYSPDGKFVATGSMSSMSMSGPPSNRVKKGGGRLWNLVTGKEGPLLAGQPNRAESVTFSPDGEFLAAASQEGVVIWRTATGKIQISIKCPAGSSEIAFSPDGKMLASTGNDQALRLWETSTGKERCHFGGQDGYIGTPAFDPSGTKLATGGGDTTVLIWDVTGGTAQSENAKPSTGDLEKWWAELAAEDAAKAYQAIWSLVRTRELAVAFLKNHVQPAPVRVNRIPELLAQLDSDRFSVREQATTALQAMGDSAEPALRKALEAKPSLEMRRRIEQLLSEMTPSTIKDPAKFQALRSIEVLEHIGLSGLPILEHLATGEADDVLTKQARKSIKRVNGKRPRPN